MSQPTFTLDPAPVRFDVSTTTGGELPARIERVALEHIELAENPRREITAESIDRLAKMLCASGQLVPCIGRRPDPDQPGVILYDGQRRYLAAKASHGLAGSEYMHGLAESVRSLIVLLLDHAPTPEEIRRLQAHCQQREELSLTDQQQQFADCWHARAGLLDADRIAAVCNDLGISAKRAQPPPPADAARDDPHPRRRTAERRADLGDDGEQARRHARARPAAHRGRRQAHHQQRAARQGDPRPRRVRTPHGRRGRAHLRHPDRRRRHARRRRTGRPRPTSPDRWRPGADRRDPRLRSAASRPRADALAARARARALKLRITPEIRDRARNGRYAFVHDRGQDFAAGIWVIDAAFMLDLVHEQLNDGDTTPARKEAYFAGARINDDELRDAAGEDERRRAQARARHAEATRSNLGLGHDIRGGLIQPTEAQLHALRQILCRLLVRDYRHVIAYGAGWTDPDRQRPVGDTGRHEPAHVDAIIEAEIERALDDPDPMRGIAQITARWAAAFVLDPAGVTRTKALGSDRMERKLRDALPGGDGALRPAVWEFMRPMLSPALVALNRDAFVIDKRVETTVDLDARRAASDLDELALDDEPDAEAA